MEHKETTEKQLLPGYTVQFTVTGNCPFPLDLLCFAYAWPATSVDAATIAEYSGGFSRGEITLVTDRGFGNLPGFNGKARRQFEEFGWLVTSAELIAP